jgi:isoleucyl-tRNA synthetase
MAPFTPLITEQVWQDLFADQAQDSVHLTAWPVLADGTVPGTLDDDALLNHVDLTRKLVELGRAARASATAKTRQPLAAALVTADGFAELPEELKQQLGQELNVQQVVDGRASGDLTDFSVKANFRSLGARYAQHTPSIAKAINELTGDELARMVDDVRGAGAAQIVVAGIAYDLVSDDVTITETARLGWAVAADHGISIALDTAITPELRALGISRDVVRVLQEARKQAGFGISDRITLVMHTQDNQVRAAIEEHSGTIAGEVLALDVQFAESAVLNANAVEDELGFSALLTRIG